jgi:hypothetical protein
MSAAPVVAALFVERGGAYWDDPRVDAWDEARDARLYAGPLPVIAHPPCRNWSIMGQCRTEIVRGEDGGCFAAALEAVRTFGGVLEHPRYSAAWRHFGLTPPVTAGWTRTLFGDHWTIEVDQSDYGHAGHKPTWLLFVGDAPPVWPWFPPSRAARYRTLPGRGNGSWRSSTPPAFREALIALATGSCAASEDVPVVPVGPGGSTEQ